MFALHKVTIEENLKKWTITVTDNNIGQIHEFKVSTLYTYGHLKKFLTNYRGDDISRDIFEYILYMNK